MKLYLGLRCFVVFSLLRGFAFGEESSGLLDLNQFAKILKFPRDQLVISDYLETEKAAYTKRTASEYESNQAPSVDANSIYESHLITSKTKNTFLPIVITLSKPDTYLTPKVKKLVADYEPYAEAQRSKGEFFPFGKFDLLGSYTGALFHEEIRVIADLSDLSEAGDTSEWIGKYVTKKPALVSIGREPSGEVDIRITQDACLPNGELLVKVAGGEKYFETFYEEPEGDSKEPPREARKEVPILDIFKGLNQIVLNSPIMDPYRKTPVVPPNPQNRFTEEAAEILSGSSGTQNVPETSPPVAGDSSKWGLPVWIYLLLFLVGAGAVTAWLWKTRG